MAQLSITTSQSQPQLVLQPVQVAQFSLDVRQFLLQSALHRRARLHPVPTQPQKPPNLTELESQALHTAHEGQRFHIVFTVSSEATFSPRRPKPYTLEYSPESSDVR